MWLWLAVACSFESCSSHLQLSRNQGKCSTLTEAANSRPNTISICFVLVLWLPFLYTIPLCFHLHSLLDLSRNRASSSTSALPVIVILSFTSRHLPYDRLPQMETAPLLSSVGGLPGPTTLQDHVSCCKYWSHHLAHLAHLTGKPMAAGLPTSQPFSMENHPTECPSDPPRIRPRLPLCSYGHGCQRQAYNRIRIYELEALLRLCHCKLLLGACIPHHHFCKSPLQSPSVPGLTCHSVVDIHPFILPARRRNRWNRIIHHLGNVSAKEHGQSTQPILLHHVLRHSCCLFLHELYRILVHHSAKRRWRA